MIHEPTEHTRVPLILWIVLLSCAVVLPGMAWVVESRPLPIRYEQAFGMAFGALLVALALAAILSRGFKTRLRWSLGVTGVTLLALFQWPTLTNVGKVLASSVPIPMIQDLVPVLAGIGLIWIAARRAGEWPFAAIVTSVLLALVVALLFAAIPNSVLASPVPRGAAEPDAADAVLIVMDGYARADVLDEQFGYDNSGFLTGMEQVGFVVAGEANANYSYTYASIASMLELDYVYDLGTVTDEDHGRMRSALSGAPQLFEVFRAAGYEIVFAESSWGGSHCGASVDVCIREGFTERILWSLSDVTIFAPLVRAVRPHPFHSVSVEHLESLPSMVAADRVDDRPRLTMVHILLPHPPYLLDERCDYVNTATRRAHANLDDDLIDERRAFYAGQLECTNKKLLETVSAIVERNPRTHIMITGDHGSEPSMLLTTEPEDLTDSDIRERMGIFSAYRLPGCETVVYPTLSPVNGTRTLANCAVGSGFEQLPDLTLWTPPQGVGVVIDVADRLES